jgi:hypothetical protein
MAFGDTYNVDQNGNPINDAAKGAEQKARIASITSAINAGQPLTPGDRRLAEQHFGVGKLARMGSGITTIDGEQQADRPYWAILNPNSRSWEPFTVQIPQVAQPTPLPMEGDGRPVPSPRPTPTPPPSMEPQIAEGRQYVANYVASPKFRERLASTLVAQGRNPADTPMDQRHIQNTLQQAKLTYVPDWWTGAKRIFNGERSGMGTFYVPRENQVYLYGPKLENYNPGAVSAHEFGHTLSKSFPIHKTQKELIKGAQTSARTHVSAPEETRADIYGLRYLASKYGVYDAGTQDFTPAHLDALIEAVQRNEGSNKSLDRMLQQYGRDNFIMLMNTIAQNQRNNIPDNAV